ncbi:hypothetical protein [Amycolatopsis sp. lyj-109]|uniref:hypothetical protein n=1 Tax=Amycolatopsis sp. lyj-109 TaxID=2789287 RepID=UPI0039792DEA
MSRAVPDLVAADGAISLEAETTASGSRRLREVAGAPAIGTCRGSVVGGLAAMFLRGGAAAVRGIFVSLGGAIVSLCRASQRGLQAGTRGPFPLLRRLERRVRALLPRVGVAGAPVGGKVRSPPAEVVHALRGEARGLRGDRARIDRGVHPTTIPRSPGAVSAGDRRFHRSTGRLPGVCWPWPRWSDAPETAGRRMLSSAGESCHAAAAW